MGTISVDPLALRIAAARFDHSADILNAALSSHLGALRSGVGIDQLVTGVTRWQQSARDLATALRVAADRYADSEAHAAVRLR